MSKTLRSRILSGGLALLAVVLIISGCSNNSPVNPAMPQAPELGLQVQLSSTTTVDAVLISKSVGGVIQIERKDYVHTFTVPANAISSNTLISVKSSDQIVLGEKMIVFEFGPDGLIFSKSAVLSFEMAELSAQASSGKLYYLDPSSGKWVYQGSSDVSNGVANFNINHFSKYAIGD